MRAKLELRLANESITINVSTQTIVSLVGIWYQVTAVSLKRPTAGLRKFQMSGSALGLSAFLPGSGRSQGPEQVGDGDTVVARHEHEAEEPVGPSVQGDLGKCRESWASETSVRVLSPSLFQKSETQVHLEIFSPGLKRV